MYFSLKFNIWLKWKDIRLTFQNLRETTFQNEVSAKKIENLWKPRLKYVNSQSKETEKQILQYNQLSSAIMLSRKGPFTAAPLSQWDEARVYNSSETDLWVVSSHYLDFKCQFDLTYFPFDNQKCYITVSMPFKLYKELYT